MGGKVKTIGFVVRSQCPMLFTFEEDQVEFVATVLAESIEMAHNVIDMFSEKDPEDLEW